MRKIKFIVIALLSIGIMSCSKSDKVSKEEKIIGAWKLESGNYNGTITAEGFLFPITFTAYLKDIDESNRLNFNEDHSFNSSLGSFTYVYEMDIFGTIHREEIVFDNFFGEGTWEIEKDTLVMESPNAEVTWLYQIESLSSSALVISIDVQSLLIEGSPPAGIEGADIRMNFSFSKR